MVDVYATFNTSFNFGNTLWINFNLQVYKRLVNRLQTNNAILNCIKKEARKGRLLK